ncbi:MAG TPA: hypothetical protein VMJ10_26725 [Kofleriaceae bacterium]|nr:hypothetical protein [Kofleriaceae bacterium]
MRGVTVGIAIALLAIAPAARADDPTAPSSRPSLHINLSLDGTHERTSFTRSFSLACSDSGCDTTRPIAGSVVDEKAHQRDNAIASFATAAVGGVLRYVNRGGGRLPVLQQLVKVLDRFDVSSTRGGGTFGLRGHF